MAVTVAAKTLLANPASVGVYPASMHFRIWLEDWKPFPLAFSL